MTAKAKQEVGRRLKAMAVQADPPDLVRESRVFFLDCLFKLIRNFDFQAPPQQTQIIEDCPICNYPYADTYERTPRVLPCGHTYCTSCIDRMLLPTSIRCPLCNAVHRVSQLDPLQFPANYAVMQVLLENQPEQAVQEMCDYCKIKEATLVCVNCAPPQLFRFCDTCDKGEHGRPFPPVQSHRRYPINAIPAHVRMVSCSTHPQEKAVYYSIEREEYFCRLCEADPSWPDRSQDALPIAEAAQQLRKQSQRINRYSFDYYQRLNNTQHGISGIMNQLTPSANAAKEEIQRKFNELSDIIKQRQEELVTYIEHEVRRLWEECVLMLRSTKWYLMEHLKCMCVCVCVCRVRVCCWWVLSVVIIVDLGNLQAVWFLVKCQQVTVCTGRIPLPEVCQCCGFFKALDKDVQSSLSRSVLVL